jgi:lysophospholipid acyltransferase (LPLAT)-like uncharacterized protein
MKPPTSAGRWLGVPIVAALASTWRIRVEGGEHEESARRSGRGFIYVIWHETLLPQTWVHRVRGDISMLVSASLDGEYLAHFAQALGYGTIRGATGQDGVRALHELADVVRNGRPAAVAVDGPLGPRRVASPGALVAAQRGGAQILPLHCRADRGWRFGSWDRFLVPKPFATVTFSYGAPFEVAPGETGLEQGMQRLAAAFTELTRGDPL